MRPKLEVELGLDGKGFEAGFAKLGTSAQGAAVGMGRTLGSGMVRGMVTFIGIGAITRMARESMRWAKDVEAVKKEYADLGVVVDNEVAQKMVVAGREFARIGMQWRIMWLPVISNMAMGIQAIAQSLKTAWIYWTAIGKGTSGKVKGWRDTSTEFMGEFFGRLMAPKESGQSNIDQLKQAWDEASKAVGSMPDEVQSFNDILKEAAAAVAKYDREVIEQMTQDYINWQNIGQAEDEKRTTIRSGSATRPSLTSIGGTVGLLEDRLFRIEQEQLRQLKAIETNTKKTNSGTFAL